MRPPLLPLLVLLAPLVTGCRFGMDYTGDEAGLVRASVPVASRPGEELSYLVQPAPGRPQVVFVHGSPGLGSMYSDYLRELGGEAEAIAVDRLGYGASKASGVVPSFEEQAAAIAPLLEERDGRWPIVVGHSLGGPIAARLAADHPDKVGALVIVAGNLDSDLEVPRWYNEVARWWIVHPFLAGFLQVSNREMWAAPEQVARLQERLDRVTCPVFVIHGTEDSLVPFEAIEYTVDRFEDNPRLYVMVLIGEDHSITKLRHEEVLETVQELLAGMTNPMVAP